MRPLLLPFLLLASYFTTAQNNLSGSRQSSAQTLIYQLTLPEAQRLYTTNLADVSDKYLHNLIDSFTTETPNLRPGNYVFARAQNNRIQYTLEATGDVLCKLLNNNHDLVVALHNKEGGLLTTANVSINSKNLLYDAATQTYRRKKQRKDGLLQVVYNAVVYPFPITRHNTYYRPPLTFWQRVSRSVPVKYIAGPIKKWFGKKRPSYNRFNYRTASEQKYSGFAVLNKPLYKPADTVRLKAFVTTKKGAPISGKLWLRLSSSRADIDTVLAVIEPYRDGAYEYSFALSDSLGLDLDEDYQLTLEKGKGVLPTKGDDDDEAANKRPVVMRTQFKYEEYELAAITFSARSSVKEHSRGQQASIYLKATDENNLPVPDGRLEVIVKPSSYGTTTFTAPMVFLPDTLWRYEQPLEAIGETRINIPDSIFPHAGFDYDVECIFLNSNNERQTYTLRQTFTDKAEKIEFTQVADSLRMAYVVRGKSTAASATVYGFNEKEDTVSIQQVQLPATIKLHPFVKMYEVETDSVYEDFEPENQSPLLSAAASRTKDSVRIQLFNPHHLPVWYTVFAGNKIILRGRDSLSFIRKTHTAKHYFLSYQYIANDKVYNEDYTIPYRDKMLALQFIQPAVVYPGQHTDITVQVSDAAGKPVPGADVTAWAYTKKFTQSQSPFVPYYGKQYPGRKRYATFHAEDETYGGSTTMDWERWSRELHLDSIEYYKFLHPQTLYINTEPADDSITQIAPFVVLKGALQPVHHIYIDEVPVFFNAAQQARRYSFRVSAGRHSFRLRTATQLITLDSFTVAAGVKTFLSINADSSNHRIRIQPMPDTLTAYEKTLWSRYLLLIENTFSGHYATITNPPGLYLLNQPNYNQPLLVGPLTDRYAQLSVAGGFTQTFEAEGGYRYQISPGLIKQKQVSNLFPFNTHLSRQEPATNFNDDVLTGRQVDSLWTLYLYNRSAQEDLFTNVTLNKQGNGRLQIGNLTDSSGRALFVRNVLLFKYADPDFVRIYRGNATDLGYIEPGRYRLLFLLKEDAYALLDSIVIKKGGTTYYKPGVLPLHKKDSVSSGISTIINNRDAALRWSRNGDDFNGIKESFNSRYLDSSMLTEHITGKVTDEKGEPVPFATIKVKGTMLGTRTDAAGLFTMRSVARGTLVASAIGYTAQELKVIGSDTYSFVLSTSQQNLSEVVVIGYGKTIRRELAGAVSSISITTEGLFGKVAGLSINGSAGSSSTLLIRGIGSFSSSAMPLIIVDGVPYTGSLSDLDPSLIANVSVLKEAAATAIYGAAAANGVIIITTKAAVAKQATTGNDGEATAATTLRRHFKDDAWWQPKLTTDGEGKATFNVTYPDDITAWKTSAIAVTNHKQTGYTEAEVKSFKVVSGSLLLPPFSVEGDTLNVIGKALNYGMDTLAVKRSFYTNNQLVKESALRFQNAWIDTFAVAAASTDSIALKYTIQKSDGYLDGEERTIPVYRQGVLQSDGMFVALRRDTTFTLPAGTDTGTLRITAQSSVLPVLESEVESLRNYEYLCNEQLASKLKAALVQKKIDSFLHRPFKGDKNIRELIDKLSQSKATSGLWGWWAGNEWSAWISLHVLEAVTQAQHEGYQTNINTAALTAYLVYALESYKGTEKAAGIKLLFLLNAKADYKKYIDSVSVNNQQSLYDKLQWLELRQRAGLPVALDTFITRQSRTMMGNIYWGDNDSHRFFDNDIQCTLSMYRLLKTAGGHIDLLEKMQGYFLEQRRPGHWRNTYEASLILETILPDLLVTGAAPQPSALTLSGAASATVATFPFSMDVKSAGAITITKTGRLPVYFTAYRQHWNKAPEKVSGDLSVRSYFEANGAELLRLKAGKPVLMKVAVTIKADAEYVLIEVPVPAGCSYQSKAQHYENNEVHREYFKNKVSIFCSGLKKGSYVFTVSLLPRYPGKYHLNPAKAELMYFPVFYGREAMKKVAVE